MGGNTMTRLSDSLFDELARLESVDVDSKEAMELEIRRAKAIQGIAREINQSAAEILDSARLRAEWSGSKNLHLPPLLGGK